MGKWITIASLTLLPLLLAGCGGRLCIAFCTNQVQLQHDYEDARDQCRELAELKMAQLNNAPDAQGQAYSITRLDRDDKSRLVGLFSDCMIKSGWLVPGPSDDKLPPPSTVEAGIISPVAPVPLQVQGPTPEQQQNYLRRQTECAFARQAADSSMIARKRAQACDLECWNAARQSPEAPPHPACEPQ